MKYLVLVLLFLSTVVCAKPKYHVVCVNEMEGYTETYKNHIVEVAAQGSYGTIIFLKNNVIVQYKKDSNCKVTKN